MSSEEVYLKSTKIPTYQRFLDKKICDLGQEKSLVFLDRIKNYIEYGGEFNDCYTSMETLMYPVCQSITQSLRSQAGTTLEKYTEKALLALDISFGKQVIVMNNMVCHKKPAKEGYHILDFIVPKPKNGDDLKGFVNISCKTILRERFMQDSHILTKKTILVTHDKNNKAATQNGLDVAYVERSDTILYDLKQLLFEKLL